MSKNDIHKGLQEWKNIESRLEELYKIREKLETFTLMDKGFSLFYSILKLVNNIDPTQEIISINELKIKPINVEERLSFIQGRKGSFHSFKQLAELFKELEKLYAKKASLEKI